MEYNDKVPGWPGKAKGVSIALQTDRMCEDWDELKIRLFAI
jgi:hypothetical protein